MAATLLQSVVSRLAQHDPPWTEVSRRSGVPYSTLKKIATGVTPNPGVLHVQRLADFFASVGAADVVRQPQTNLVPAAPFERLAAQESAHA